MILHLESKKKSLGCQRKVRERFDFLENVCDRLVILSVLNMILDGCIGLSLNQGFVEGNLKARVSNKEVKFSIYI